MKSCEKYIDKHSDYYVYTPSVTARQLFFYPLQCGHFIYEAGYSLSREAFDSFLLLYAEHGCMAVTTEAYTCEVSAGQFLFLDCYRPHAYRSSSGCECLWLHFDGSLARGFYEAVAAHSGIVISPKNPYPAREKLRAVYDLFQNRAPIREPLVSKYINDLLTFFLLNQPQKSGSLPQASISEEAAAFIREHFAEDIPVEALAKRAGLSPYHFIRVFKRETGFTPHQYLVDTRIAAAKYLLKNSPLSAKSICFQTGFSCESVFCSAFKKHEGVTPAEYRST
ncbi:MAG: AraC family transcriptional regulator [Lachnospiraceae bacterium]|nr:AraC family transcriptional regulator [Lachnospiraceae bacterium]